MTIISRVADTDKQEKVLLYIEKIAKSLKFNIRVGTKIGKYPQTVILDHAYQDSLIYINSDGQIKIKSVFTQLIDIKTTLSNIQKLEAR